MKFKSVLIVTYGRSGSTLLQGLLNSIDGCLVRGENHNMCHGLFQTYSAMLQSSLEHVGTEVNAPTNPWFGAKLLEPESFLGDCRRIVRQQLLANEDESSVRCLGFKEIRYPGVDRLPDYLDFLGRIFPETAFLFLTRDHESVSKSAWWKNIRPAEVKRRLNVFETDVRDWAKGRRDVFAIDYSDLSAHSARVGELFSFLGAAYDRDAVAAVLARPHSYAPPEKQSESKKARKKARPVAIFDWLQVSVEETSLPLVSVDDTLSATTPGIQSLGGVIVLPADSPESASLKLRAISDGGESSPVIWGLPSPVAGKRFAKLPQSGKARFLISPLPAADGSYELYLHCQGQEDQVIAVLIVNREQQHLADTKAAR